MYKLKISISQKSRVHAYKAKSKTKIMRTDQTRKRNERNNPFNEPLKHPYGWHSTESIHKKRKLQKTICQDS